MGEDIEPLDPVDAAVNAEGAIALEDALLVEEVDELDAEAGLDNERILLLDDLHGSGMYPEADSGHGRAHENSTKPSPQARRERRTRRNYSTSLGKWLEIVQEYSRRRRHEPRSHP